MSRTIFGVILLFLGVQGICGEEEQNATLFDDVFYDIESNVSYPIIEPLFTPCNELTYGGPSCRCMNHQCSCCTGIRLKWINFDRKICLVLTYADGSITVSLTQNDQEIISKTISVKDPPEICTGVPYVPLLKLCIALNDIKISGGNLHACPTLAARVVGFSPLVLKFGCVDI